MQQISLRSLVLGLCMGVLLGACWRPAFGQTAVVRLDNSAELTSVFPAPLDVAAGLDINLTVQEVALLPRERFVPFDRFATHPIGINTPLWLRLQIHPGQAKVSSWLIEMPTVIVDRYEVYQRDANDVWRMSVAGDRVAYEQWPTRSLRPRFPLQATGSGVRDVFIRIVQQLPANIQPVIVHTDAAAQRDMSSMLWTGLLAGLLGALLFICLQMTLAYRDWTYLWYAGYLLATLLAAMAYTGVGQKLLWPQATKFASDAIVYFVLAAFAFNLQFTTAMFGRRLGKHYVWASSLLILACIGYMIQTLVAKNYAQAIGIFLGISVAVCLFILFAALQAWRKKFAYSGYWLLVYLPYLISIALVLAESTGQISLPWLPDNTPVISAMFEAVVMMLCLNAFSRESHAQAVREQTTAQRDPLTGFLAEAPFLELAASTWQRASRSGRDVTIAYALVETKNKDLSTVEAEAMMLRSVRMVRIAMRDGDSVGRIGRNMLGIAMAGAYFGDDLNARLSRLVALGLMVDESQSADKAIKFTLAAGAWRETPEDFSAIDKKLRSLLHESTGERPRTIRFLSNLDSNH